MLKLYVATQGRLADIKDRFSNLGKDEDGAALVEYALLIGLMAVASIAALTALQGKLSGAYGVIGTKLAAIK